jgi:hypothetical protein
MKKYLLSVVITLALTGAAFADPPDFIPPGHQYGDVGSVSTTSSVSTSGSSSTATTTTSTGSSAYNGGNTVSTFNMPPKPPATFFTDGNISVGSTGSGTSFFVTVPKKTYIAPGVRDVDGQVFVDGLNRSCDNAQRGGLKPCFVIGG